VTHGTQVAAVARAVAGFRWSLTDRLTRRRIGAYVGWLKRRGTAPHVANQVYWALYEKAAQARSWHPMAGPP
jgi:hypothetical protein